LETIVIINDEKELIQIISEYLKLHPVDVVGTGHNGLEAVCLYEKHRPDYVLIDLNMPKYDGFYGISKIKEIDKNAKNIIMTGFMDKIKNEKLASELIILEKPFRLSKLKQIIMPIKFNRF
jgi:YesN/AraC family two-component response regulator